MDQQPNDHLEPGPEVREGDQDYGLHRCAHHPEVETGLACGKCGTYICPRCMVTTSVGSRCRDCAHMTRLPTYDVQPGYMMRAALAGGVAGIVVGVIWGYLMTLPIPFMMWLASIGAGYAIGESVSIATNRKRGQTLSVIAGAGVVIAVVTLLIMNWPLSGVGLVFLILFGGLATYMAAMRVR